MPSVSDNKLAIVAWGSAGTGSTVSSPEGSEQKAPNDINGYRMFGGVIPDPSLLKDYASGLPSNKTGVDTDPPRMSVPPLNDSKWESVGWGSTLKGHSKAPDQDEPTTQPWTTSPPQASSIAHFEHFNAPRKPSSGPHHDLAWNNFLPGLKTDQPRSPDAEPTRMHVPSIDTPFRPPIGTMSLGRGQNPPTSFGTSFTETQDPLKSPNLQPDGFRRTPGDDDDLKWNNGQPGLSTPAGTRHESEPVRMDVHIYTTPSGTLSGPGAGSEGRGSVIPRTGL